MCLMCGGCLLRTTADREQLCVICPLVVRDFNQVLVWVSNVNGSHFSHCAVAFDRTFINANFLFAQVSNHFVERG